jgi:hypothetical protein
MDEGDELKSLAGCVPDKSDPLCAADSADAAVSGGHFGNFVNPENREAVDPLTTTLRVQILHESLEFEGWNIAEEICHLAREGSCSKDQDWIRRAGHSSIIPKSQWTAFRQAMIYIEQN